MAIDHLSEDQIREIAYNPRSNAEVAKSNMVSASDVLVCRAAHGTSQKELMEATNAKVKTLRFPDEWLQEIRKDKAHS